MKKEKFLPVGSVIVLKDATKKLMITGYCSMTPEHKGKLFDYTGCLYPEGLLSSDQICLFDHEQINEIVFLGYQNDEYSDFIKKLESNYNVMLEMAQNQE